MSMFVSHANGGFDVTLFLYYGLTDLAALLFKVKDFYLWTTGFSFGTQIENLWYED